MPLIMIPRYIQAGRLGMHLPFANHARDLFHSEDQILHWRPIAEAHIGIAFARPHVASTTRVDVEKYSYSTF
jgi:hypothetical protein